MQFKNGNTIQTIENTNSVRGNRSKLIGFYCLACNNIHIDFPIADTVFIDEEIIMCRQGFNQAVKSL